MINSNSNSEFRCGYITIIGRPNVGKSTLLNQIVGQKLSITSRKPQTTQQRLLGIKTDEDHQAIYVDTPGIQDKYQDTLHRHMKRVVNSALLDLDVLIFVVECSGWTAGDQEILDSIASVEKPVVLVVNKTDKIKNKEKLLPFLKQISEKREFTDIIPISAKKSSNVKSLEQVVSHLLPVGDAEFSEDQISDRSERFLVAEFLREKLVRNLGQELPYRLTVTVEEFKRTPTLVTIHFVIWVQSSSQKSIIIGKDGGILKRVGEQARKDMEILLGSKVNVKTWVKIKKNWNEDQNFLNELGFE